MSLPTLSIVIISYQCGNALRNCLKTLSKEGTLSPICVVDNASDEDNRATIAGVHWIQNSENRGFAVACNQGIKATTEDFILILNPDTGLSVGVLSKLLDFMAAHPEAGACGPRLLNTDGSLQPSCRRFPILRRLILDELGLGKLFPKSKLFGDYRMTWWNHDEPREVEQLMGAALLLRRQALNEVGLFDEQFFMYFEEVDLCLRLQQKGWKCWFVPEAEAIHAGGESAKKNFIHATFWRYQSLCKFYRKHYPQWHLVILKGAVGLAGLVRILAYSVPPFRNHEKRDAFVKVTTNLFSL